MTGPVMADGSGEGRAALVSWGQAIDATWQQLNAAAPAIPGRPEPPPHDDGAGAHGSVPLLPNDPRLDVHGAVWAAAVAVAPLYPNGSAHLQHFLDNTGTPMTVNVDDVLRDVPAVATKVDEHLQAHLRAQVVQHAVDTGQYGVPQKFTVPWFTHNIMPEENRDWHYAIGNGEFSVTGVATVHERPGGPPRVDVDYQVHFYDRYNWDLVEGKQAKVFGVIPAPDLVLAQLHQAGIAKEYDSVGTSSTYSGEVR